MKKFMACLMAIVMMATLSVSALAAESDFVPSVEMKPGPEIVDQVIDGVPGKAVIVLPDGREVVVPEGAIVITPISKKDEADDDTKKELEDAFDKIVNADSLEELIDGLQGLLGQIADGTDAEDLIVTDLFHVDLTGDYAKYIDEGGQLRIKLKASDDLLALLQQNGDEWEMLHGDLFVDNGDGTYTLIINKLGVYAFVRDVVAGSVDYDDPAQSSPQTGDMLWVVMLISGLLAVSASFCFVMAKKQKA